MPTNETTLDSKQLKSITDRLDAIIRMISLSLPDNVSKDTKVDVLSKSGFQPSEIALILGMTPNAVRIKLFNIRKKKVKPI